ncbi:MAG: SGNH/GDSL hydrolase family protein [Actinomycetota bacterium]|nr:SGNH/GDSL hydrolase family protein [Actinomycetota bacterium]
MRPPDRSQLHPCRYVAIGDSFTEGVGDLSKHLPNGVRGWADRVAEGLAKSAPGWQYANLAVRSKRLRQIVAEQLQPALEMRPTLVTVYAGGNDILDVGTRMPALLDDYEALVARVAETGATVVLFTGFDIPVSVLLRPFERRNRLYNERVRRVARDYGAVLVDYWAFDVYRDRRMWAPDRMHMSKAGHKYLAKRVLDILGVAPMADAAQRSRTPPRAFGEWLRAQREWTHDWVLPLMHRKMQGTTLGDSLQPRWPTPVVGPPHGGLRRLVRSGPTEHLDIPPAEPAAGDAAP